MKFKGQSSGKVKDQNSRKVKDKKYFPLNLELRALSFPFSFELSALNLEPNSLRLYL